MKSIDALGCTGSAIILLFASAWIPLIGPLFSLLTPLPFLYYTVKWGFFEGVKVMGVATLTVGLISHLTGFTQILFLCIEFCLLGLIMSEVFKRQATFGIAVVVATALMLLVGVLMLMTIGLVKGVGPPSLLLGYFQANLRETLQVYGELGGIQEDPQVQETMKIMAAIVARVYPALIIIGTGFVVWLNIVISRPLFRFAHLKYPDFGPADHWRAPEPMVWGLILAGFSLFLPAAGIKFLATNILIILLVTYAFHGLAIVLFFLNAFRVPLWLRMGAYFLIVFQQVVLVLLAVAGIFDQWIDFRKIHCKKATQ